MRTAREPFPFARTLECRRKRRRHGASFHERRPGKGGTPKRNSLARLSGGSQPAKQRIPSPTLEGNGSPPLAGLRTCSKIAMTCRPYSVKRGPTERGFLPCLGKAQPARTLRRGRAGSIQSGGRRYSRERTSQSLKVILKASGLAANLAVRTERLHQPSCLALRLHLPEATDEALAAQLAAQLAGRSWQDI